MTTRRQILLAAASLLATPRAFAQGEWPQRPVKIVVPFSAGGAADVLTRTLAERLRTRLGQNFVVENITGAGGNIGMQAVQNAAPDGYTIASATIGTLSINPFLFSSMPYDPAKDFVPASTHWENCNVFVVGASHPAQTVQDFLAWARARKGGLNFGSAGVGTTPHLAGELFRVRTGLDATHIPYRGAAQSMPALVSGETDFAIDNIASYTPLIKAGKVRALAVTAAERWPTFPDLPTMAEAGVPDFVITSWGALVLSRGTPPAITHKLSTAVQAIAADPAVQLRFLELGAKAVSATPEATALFAERERTKWKEIVRISGAKPV